jgi:hypothetical protein
MSFIMVFSIATLSTLPQSIRGQFLTRNDFPRYHPRATARRRSGSTDISRYGLAFHLPDKEFRSSRFVIVVLSLAQVGLHVAMQFGPYLHPAIGMSGVWPLRILISSSRGFWWFIVCMMAAISATPS